ncbi:heterokaryon incompatibility protein-domain-containing protein [Dactylonectria macrodidyma]|uniref:Heterokaryon incompatibility protein-domain-containing protein n=1 Tax=Dactylonectria macrodidyma TaxID=307937 RepID=A0A9P9F3D0_9HYPO|nr:heterokaryon incompatibility protein-domain-containing protein [Dactylonectria macrodidyma]
MISSTRAFRTVFLVPSTKGFLSWHKLISSDMVKSAARRVVIYSSANAREDISDGMLFLPSQDEAFLLPIHDNVFDLPFEGKTRDVTFWDALSRLNDLTLVNVICLRFPLACQAVVDPSLFVEHDSATRILTLQAVFKAIKNRARRPDTARISSLTIKHLQNLPISSFTSSDLFKSVTKDLDRLHLEVVEEYHLSNRGFDLHCPERVRFEPYMRRAWLIPLASRLTSLSLYIRDCWGTMPGTFNGHSLVFPHLKTLSLGSYTISHYNHLDWVLVQPSLKSLRPDKCFIVSYMCVNNYLVEKWRTQTHDWEKLPQGAFGFRGLGVSVYHFPGTCEFVFDNIRTRLPNLVDFQFNSDPRITGFDDPDLFLMCLSPTRYIAFDRYMASWIHVNSQDGELKFSDDTPPEAEVLSGHEYDGEEWEEWDERDEWNGYEADTEEDHWDPPVKPNRARETMEGDGRALEALRKATIERRRQIKLPVWPCDLFKTIAITFPRHLSMSSILPEESMTTQSGSIYQHVPFSKGDGTHQIRRLILVRGTFNDRLVARLDTTALTHEHPPQFEALSYVWGSEDKPSQITVTADDDASREFSLAVTQNLDSALRHLRSADRDRMLWIDAICIDQGNLEERSSQVANMTTVYELATRVIVWLGPEADDSDLAIARMRDLGSKVAVDHLRCALAPALDIEPDELHWSDAACRLPYNEREFCAIETLFKRVWFTRLWVLQETRLSNPDATVVCGYSTIRWRTLLNALWCFLIKEPQRHFMIDELGRYWSLTRFLDLHDPNMVKDMAGLCHQTSFLNCSDNRDRVYALVPLTESFSLRDLDITPDYSAKVSEVYQNFVLQYINHYGDINIIAIAGPRDLSPSTVTAPSWVPSFHTRPETNYITSTWGGKSFVADWKYLEGGILRVAGIYCATVETAKPLSIPVNGTGSVQFAVQAVAPTNIRDETYVTGGSMMEAFGATLTCYEDVQYEPPTSTTWASSDITDCTTTLLETRDQQESFTSRMRYFVTIVRDNAQGRAFVTTQEGYIALAPQQTQPGDIICTLLGLQNQIVLRKMDDGTFKVVGVCFAYGLNFGEAVLGRIPDNYRMVSTYNEELKTYLGVFENKETGEIETVDPRLKSVRFRTLERKGVASERYVIERDELARIGTKVVDFDLA